MSSEYPLVSVVTPVYNGGSYIRECIESVQKQTYPNWDYTIVNNCSTDNTLEVVEEYAARDSRIRVVTNNSFVRVINNYNNAFRQVSPESKYCKVIAADDWIYPECLEQMVRLAEENPRVAIVGAYGYGFNRTGVVWDGLPHEVSVMQGREICRQTLLGGPYVFGTPTSLLFRSDIVRSRDAFFNEENFHADTEACYEFLEDNDFGFVHQVLTYSRIRDTSLTSFSQEYNTYIFGNFYMLVKYGPRYLSSAELRNRQEDHLSYYYDFLARQLIKRRPPEFWKYHKSMLDMSGYPFSKYRLALALIVYIFDLLLNPKRTLELIIERLRR